MTERLEGIATTKIRCEVPVSRLNGFDESVKTLFDKDLTLDDVAGVADVGP